MYIIEPLYAGDVSIDSDYENGEVTHPAYDNDIASIEVRRFMVNLLSFRNKIFFCKRY